MQSLLQGLFPGADACHQIRKKFMYPVL